jgi:hypothetical protein
VSVAITVGYVNVEGVNDAVVISPPLAATRANMRTIAIAAYQAPGRPTPLWVDGSPANLVADIAAHFSIPSGTPAGWFDPPVTTDSVEEPTDGADHEHIFVFRKARSIKMGGIVRTCSVPGCDAMRIGGS